MKELAEERSVLLLCASRVEPAGAHVESAGQIKLLVLSRRHDSSLVPSKHPVATDLRVEVEVDLIGLEHWLLGAGALVETPDICENALSCVARPWAKHDRLRHAEPGPDMCERTAHRADRHVRPTIVAHLETEQLARPRWTRPAEVLRRLVKKLRQRATEGVVDLRGSIPAALVVEPKDAPRGEV